MYKENINNDHNYNTPLYLFNYLNKHFKFELDPCDSGNKWFGLPHNFTKEDDGLTKDWKYNAFVNPPYGVLNELSWIRKCSHESYTNNTCNFILLPSKTESGWFSLCMNQATVIIFPQGRISFIKDEKSMNGNIMGSVLFGFFKKYDGPFITDIGKKADEFHNENVDLDIPWFLGDNTQIIYFPDRDLLKQIYS
jgi:phage N-6-adenine-methyltransferase